VKVYPEEIDSTVGLWFNDLMEKWMNLDIPKQWEKRLVSKLFPKKSKIYLSFEKKLKPTKVH